MLYGTVHCYRWGGTELVRMARWVGMELVLFDGVGFYRVSYVKNAVVPSVHYLKHSRVDTSQQSSGP